MKLYEFRTKYMTKLALYQPKNDREKELVSELMIKLNNLRSSKLPSLVFVLHQIIQYEKVSRDFKDLCRFMLEDIEKLESYEE
ncbi:MAG: hypothetical protein DRJ40_10945 [Thermoprotei archaeon]|nr:MAG: hypothetical protein DRJ40_10945 [Thermoprotei archaeon]